MSFCTTIILLLALLLQQDERQTQPPPPASQPVAAATVSDAPADPDKPEIVRDVERIDLRKLVRGEQVLTVEQLLRLGPWVQIATDLTLTVLSFIPRLLVALFLFFVFWLIYRGIRRVAISGMTRANIDPSIRDMLTSLIKWAILGFAIVIAGNQIGIQIAALLTGVSIIGLAVGFAAQETLANFIAGVVIFWDKPFKVGDWIVIDGTLGQVRRVTFRSTRLDDLDGDVVIFPNTAMLASRVVNKTTNPITRVNVPISIAYKESIDRAREVLLACLKGDQRIVTNPPPEVVVRECADSSVNLMLHFWITEERYEDAMVYDYLEIAKKTLDAAGIEIPFPHMQVFVENTPAVAALARSGNGTPAAPLSTPASS